MELTGHVSVSAVGMWAVIWCQGFLSPLAPELAGPSLSSHQSRALLRCCTAQPFLLLFS